MKKVIEASGAKMDDAKVKALVAALEGVNIDEAIKKAATVTVAAAAPAAGGAPKADAKKAAEDQAKAEESAAEGLGALFG